MIYSPSDFKNEKHFVALFEGNKSVAKDLDMLKESMIKFQTAENKADIESVINEIEKIKTKSQSIPINYLWDLNHWGSSCARIEDDKMVFVGKSAPNGTDGSNINIDNLLEVGKTYEVTCFAKSSPGTTGMFQLWCHDQINSGDVNVSKTTPYKIPSQTGERLGLIFQPKITNNIRVHLQYTPGEGSIEVSDIKITELS